MLYQDIVVQIDKPESRRRYEIAAAIAARAGGRLDGVYLKTTLIYQYASIDPIAWLPPDDLNRLVREHNAAQDEASAASGAALAAIARRAGVCGETEVLSGDTADDMIARARCADLVVMPPPTATPPYAVRASAIEVGLASGGPVLVVPEGDGPAAIGSRVLIAWNGGREAARALRDALPLLVDGAVVEIRMARPSDSEPDPLAGVRARLERRGLKVNAIAAAHPDERVADWLSHEAARTNCDLIVMGLYGHTRVREFVLGGVSRGLLHQPPLPLLISH